MNCRICGSEDLADFQLNELELIRCRDCKIIYNKHFPTEESTSDYYQSDYELSSLTGDKLADSEARRIFRYPEQAQLIKYMSRYLPKNGSILDIGCDKGFFIDEARRWGYDVAGVELSAGGRAYAERIGLNVKEDILLFDKTFDSIVMWHSFEHHLEPIEALQKYDKYLKPGGLIFIRVPNFNNFWRKMLEEKWIWMQPENHYFHYTLESLSFTIEKAGFNLEFIESRKPNNKLTKKMYKVSKMISSRIFEKKTPLRKKLGRIVEDLTGVEIFAVATKKV